MHNPWNQKTKQPPGRLNPETRDPLLELYQNVMAALCVPSGSNGMRVPGGRES